jgi:hypothetical protein
MRSPRSTSTPCSSSNTVWPWPTPGSDAHDESRQETGGWSPTMS